MKPAAWKNKRVLIMGLGLHGGGAGTATFFAKAGACVTVTDLKSKKELAPSVKALSRYKTIAFHLGGHRSEDFQKSDLVIQGPGVPEHSPYLALAKKAGIPIKSDVEIFFELSPAPIIGITGTKGKSTTTWLIGEFLKKTKHRVFIGGNIRRSMLEFLGVLKPNDHVVLELSSFQLDALAHSHISPHIAVITNIFPDHLNRYSSFAAYKNSKSQIFAFQKKGDTVFIPEKDSLLKKLVQKAPGKTTFIPVEKTIKPFALSTHPAFLPYHYPNVALAIRVAEEMGVDKKTIAAVLKKFHGLPGRMEIVGHIRGVTYINDTTATNPGAATEAVIATKQKIKDGALHVIAGGYEKGGLPITLFVAALKKYAASVIFLPGEATKKIQKALGHRGPRQFSAGTMASAVHIAKKIAKAGDTVLLSPGAASFGLFKHEFDRGEQFEKEVRSAS